MTLEENIRRNNMLIPDYSKPTIVDLMRTVYSKKGVSFGSAEQTAMMSLVKDKKHIVFILIDGMGSNLVNSMPANNILRKNKKCDLFTVNPSSTGAVLASVATAEYPAQHGILGWYSYNRQADVAYYPLLFKARDCDKSLAEYKLRPNDIFRTPSVMGKLQCHTTAFFPNMIVNSEYSKFTVSDDSARIGYNDIDDAFAKVEEHISKLNEPSFTYLYIPDIDSSEHDCGVYSDRVKQLMQKISAGVERLSKINPAETSIIITADHGQTDVGGHDIIMDFNKYSEYFYAMPGIDFGTATFYVKPDKTKEFENEFRKDFDGLMFLHKTEDYFRLHIFGSGEASDYAKSNFGEYIGFCKKGYYFLNSKDTESYVGKVAGNHSGFSSDELTIPLIIL